MARDKDNFCDSGPSYLRPVNWNDENHRRSVAASLVKGVYTLERDRQLKRKGPAARAPLWSEFFNFKLHSKLVDHLDSSIYCAIYELNPANPNRNHSLDESPRYVIAFRGTMIKKRTFVRDLIYDLNIGMNKLHRRSRVKNAIEEAAKLLSTVDESKVWLVGHSLGAAIALLVGRTMAAERGKLVQSFLFNPPFASFSIEMMIEHEKLNTLMCFGTSFFKAGLASVKNFWKGNSSADSFSTGALSEWCPCLYVNSNDPVCSKYIAHFKCRRKMEEIGLGWISKWASQVSVRTTVMAAVGTDSNPSHLIPSANITTNLNPDSDAHSISHWWRHDLQLESEIYENDENHRRCVAASLVNGVYTLERDRQLKRNGTHQALAPPWWEFFNFQLHSFLVDKYDSSIYCAIYEFNPPDPNCNDSLDESPSYVIAFRGTMIKKKTFLRDLENDLSIVTTTLHRGSRFKDAIEEVRKVVSNVEESKVWLVGHSLGATLALLVGKTMAVTAGKSIQTFLFNLPFLMKTNYISSIFSLLLPWPFDIILPWVFFTKTSGTSPIFSLLFPWPLSKLLVVVEMMDCAMKFWKGSSSTDSFAGTLSEWRPCLYVNSNDPVSSQCIGYFKHRKKMEEIGLQRIAKLALRTIVGTKSRPSYSIPSVLITRNLNPAKECVVKAHEIRQWWGPDLQVESKSYQYE